MSTHGLPRWFGAEMGSLTSLAPQIAVCVVTFNSAGLIHDLIASLDAGCARTRWSLFFADNASTDQTVSEIRREAPAAEIVHMGANRGYAAGINAAVGAAMRASGNLDGFLLINADVRLRAGCTAALHSALISAPSAGITVPRLIDADGQLIWSLRRTPTALRAWADALLGAERAGRWGALGEVVTARWPYRRAHDVAWAEGSTLLVSPECWAACGPWNETFFLYSEETDFALRAGDHGFTVRYEPFALAQHLEGGSAESARQWSLLVMNRVRLFAQRHGPIRSALFWCAVVVREASRAALGKPTSRAAVRDLVSRRRWREKPSATWLEGVRV